MGTVAKRDLRLGLLSAFVAILAAPLDAATYLPISDADLVRRSPIVVRAQVEAVAVRLEVVSGRQMPMTIVTLQPLESIKGRTGETFQVRLPGGRVGSAASWVPGTPVFEEGQEALLFLRPAAGRRGDFFLSEFGLSRFDIRTDADGRRFALRPAFPPDEDDALSKRTAGIAPASPGSAVQLRDADAFVKSLKAIARGVNAPIPYGEPRGSLADKRGRIQPLFVNLGGREPGDCGGGQPCLFRWFWDTGASPNGIVAIVGTQSNLSDSSNGTPQVQNAVTQWTSVPGSDVRYSGPATLGSTVSVQLDAAQSFDNGASFNTPLACGAGGLLGLGGTQNASGPPGGGSYTFKGDANYFAMQTGIVTMRKVTGSPGCYDTATFRTAVMHEIGHTLGFGHPDQGQSTHSTTTSADWAVAVMHSFVPPSKPSTPQTDDIQAVLFYYGTGVVPTATPTRTPTRTPTGTSGSSSRGHVTPLRFVTPKSNVNGRS
jgi:hypothetical protein